MPHVLDYVGQKSAMYDLRAQHRNWQRKLQIMSMAARRARVLMKRAVGASRQDAAAAAMAAAAARGTGGAGAGGAGGSPSLSLPPI